MICPRCNSPRIQRDYDDATILARVAGLRKILCNNCGLVFSRFDPFGKLRRAPAEDIAPVRNRRRGARYYAHLPCTISQIEGGTRAGKVSYSQPSRGHCDMISKFGMGLSLVGTRFPEGELSTVGRLLFVRVDLPEGAIEAVVTIVTHDRSEGEGKGKWFLGVNIYQMSEADTATLAAYLEKRAQGEPLIVSE